MKKIAVVFPGQGSQKIGMLANIAEHFPEIKETFVEASNAIDLDLWEITQHSEALLNQTENTQPILLTAEIALWRIFQKGHLVKPDYLAGHSLGEYTALVVAESLAFSDAVKIVKKRGEFMQDAVKNTSGGMLAVIGLSQAEVQLLCESSAEGEVLAMANINSPEQIVLAGNILAIERAEKNAKAAGAKLAVRLPMSVPSHCSLLQSSADALAAFIQTFSISDPKLPVINNADVAIYTSAASVREGLIKQLTHPVRWAETVSQMQSLGVTEFIECGPGKVLTGLIRRMFPNVSVFTVDNLDLLQNKKESI